MEKARSSSRFGAILLFSESNKLHVNQDREAVLLLGNLKTEESISCQAKTNLKRASYTISMIVYDRAYIIFSNLQNNLFYITPSNRILNQDSRRK